MCGTFGTTRQGANAARLKKGCSQCQSTLFPHAVAVQLMIMSLIATKERADILGGISQIHPVDQPETLPLCCRAKQSRSEVKWSSYLAPLQIAHWRGGTSRYHEKRKLCSESSLRGESESFV